MAMPRLDGGRSFTNWPSMVISPAVMSSSPAISRNSVDLPQPEDPETTNSRSLIKIHAVDRLDIAEGLANALQ